MPQVPRSFIKSVAIQVDSLYSLTNSPFAPHDDPKNHKIIRRVINFVKKVVFELLIFLGVKKNHPGRSSGFIGREQLIAKFVKFLQSTNPKGVFLITGYRGMGKTSFVNKTLEEYKKGKRRHKDRVIPIHLTLAQSNPKEIDILRLMVISIYDEFRSYLKSKYKNHQKTCKAALFNLQHLLFLVLIISIPLFLKVWKAKDASFLLHDGFESFSLTLFTHYDYLIVILLLSYMVLYIILKGAIYFLDHADSPINRITWLVERCNAALGEELTSSGSGLPTINFKLFNEEKKTKQYAVVNAKEIEYELQQFLRKAKSKFKLDFIFVFDELDKVDPEIVKMHEKDYFGTTENNVQARAYENDIKYRRQAIINIIAGLKNFFTTAEARFIFIAGREMFDASLADIADRQSAISSIFTYVFYIESLLKEKDNSNNNDPSLSTAIEQYVQYLLFGDSNEPKLFKRLESLKAYNETTSGTSPMTADEYGKLYFMVQNFITYLTYRSNGSPKKLIKEIHEFIIVEDKVENLKKYQPGQNIFYENPYQKQKSKKRIYLYFNYYNQYRIGFINYLYRPFLIKYGRSFKLYGDNIIVSTPYLLDHLLKFHPFAFSMANLELLPELMSSNKTPTLRLHIKQIIEYLGANHVREIEIGLFDYKFYSRTLNEITFLSRVFEQEAAALNYTLDESFHVKNLVIDKIKELRNDYANSWKNKDQVRQVFSIAHLNGILGDLHFFDQEYDDATVAYSDAIRTIALEKSTELSLQDFVVLVRTKLKMGLCFEKMNAYDDALAQFADCALDAARLMNYRLNKGVAIKIDREDENTTLGEPSQKEEQSPAAEHKGERKGEQDYNTAIYRSAALSDFLQIILQAYLSQTFIQEKKSVAGVSEYKIFTTLGSFFKITGGFKLHQYRNHIIKANALLHAGNLMYFKNSDRRIPLDDPDTKKAYAQNLPVKLKCNLEELIRRYDRDFKNSLDERTPSLALYLYILGMAESLNFGGQQIPEGKRKKVQKDDEKVMPDPFIRSVVQYKNIVAFLLQHLRQEIMIVGKVNRGIYYNYVASFISSIGDCLFSTHENRNEAFNFIKLDVYIPACKKDSERSGKSEKEAHSIKHSSHGEFIKEKNIADFFDISKFDDDSLENDSMLFDEFLKPVDVNTDSLADVLRTYYLSGRYYLKEGRIFSCSFQYRKILYVLRLILDKETDKTLCESFCRMLRKKLLSPLLDLTSRDSFNTDYHGYHKAREKIGEHRDGYIVNNLSNHPETREIILAYNYIRLKIGYATKDISTLISPENSFATQQSRLLELDFYAKYLEDKQWDDVEENRIKNNSTKLVSDKTNTQPFDVHQVNTDESSVSSIENTHSDENSLSLKQESLPTELAAIQDGHNESQTDNIDLPLQGIKNQAAGEISGETAPNGMTLNSTAYLYSMLSILQILDIYGADYWLGHGYTAHIHFRIATYLSKLETSHIDQINEQLTPLLGLGSFASLDQYYHYSKAKKLYDEAIQLHTAGDAYKAMIEDMIYLEDDFNDTAYHFGAALDRYLITNQVFLGKIRACTSEIRKSPNLSDELYLS